jgi:hypothetical protein
MRRLALTATACLLLVSTTIAASPAQAQPTPVSRDEVVIEPLAGSDLYTPAKVAGYRVSPDPVISGARTWVLTCGPDEPGGPDLIWAAPTGEAPNGGRVVLGENKALLPETTGPDSGGVCDPSVAKIGAYYYLTYTGVSGSDRQVFVARSSSIEGPYAKWGGTSWGTGTPQPIARFGDPNASASGPSLVVRDNTAYLFFNTRVGGATYQTLLSTSVIGTQPSDQDTWFLRLRQPVVAIEHPESYPGLDCVGNRWPADTDVKYDAKTSRYVALTTDQEYPHSVLQAYDSADGLKFTKSVITRGDYHQGARTPGLLADATGTIRVGAPTGIAYAYSSTCGQSSVRWSGTTQALLPTGAVSGQIDGALVGGSSTISVNIKFDDNTVDSWIGVHFGKVHPGDTVNDSGYVARLRIFRTFTYRLKQLCLVKVGFGDLACGRIYDQFDQLDVLKWVNLRIVQSNGNISAFLNGDVSHGVSTTDADDPYLGGFISFATHSVSGQYSGLSAWDNVPASSQSGDWSTSSGSWNIASGTATNVATSGQTNLQDLVNGDATLPTRLGDGTYAATVSLPPGGTQTAWAGLNLTNPDMTGAWSTGGYTVFLRKNGNLGIYQAGVGQVVADTPTGRNPTAAPVRLRVLKTGANLQVYVGSSDSPFINWTDHSSSAWGIGGFGLANYTTGGATFTGVTWNGDQSR